MINLVNETKLRQQFVKSTEFIEFNKLVNILCKKIIKKQSPAKSTNKKQTKLTQFQRPQRAVEGSEESLLEKALG